MWTMNSLSNKPKTGKLCEIRTVDGLTYKAIWKDRINKYVSCNRWQRVDGGLSKKEKWIDDEKVVAWRLL